MTRPLSPTSIMNIQDEEIDDSISIGFREASRIGFEYLQQKLNKTLITTGDGLQSLFNFDVHDPATDNDLLIPVYCITISLLKHSREGLETIESGLYNRLVTYSTDQLNIKHQEIS